MLLWRVSNHLELNGLGGERLEGRWHTVAAGKRIVYLSEHPAVALIETLVNLGSDPAYLPTHFQLLRIVADGAISGELSPAQVSAVDGEDFETTQATGDKWLAEGSSALLRVPSIPSPESWNYLLNPVHPDATKVKVEWAKRIAYDRRLFRLTDA
jgi:RES domain-containing protein